LNGIENYACISFDHDLGEEAMKEYFRNVKTRGIIDYGNISEKTGLDCAKYMVNKVMGTDIKLPKVYCHSANPVGAMNIINHINGYLKSCGSEERCEMATIKHTYREVSSEVKKTRLAIKNGDLK
jgi:hypothetical protein